MSIDPKVEQRGACLMATRGVSAMNPARWNLEHQIAGLLSCLLGFLAGILFAWIESPFRDLSKRSLSGAWADYSTVFLKWLLYGHYWPWPAIGTVMAPLLSMLSIY